MLLLFIGALLAVVGSFGCVWGFHINELEQDQIEAAAEKGLELAQTFPGRLYIIIGIIAIASGIVVAAIGLVKNLSAKEEKSRSKVTTKRLVVTAILLALASALSLVKIWEMPLGGSVTLCSMLPVTLIAIEYGTKWGLKSAFVYGLIQFGLTFGSVFGWGLSPAAVIGCILLDYILAFTMLGFAGLFRKKGTPGICISVALALTLRFLCHVLSGVIIFDVWMPEEWSNPLLYSLCYNGAFMLPELVLTMVVAVLLFKTPHFNKLVMSNLEK